MKLILRSLAVVVVFGCLTGIVGCYQLQHAVGCNNPGLFGCKDKPEFRPQGPEASPELQRA
ncbi:MAG: hypothetical protein P8M72_09865 [Gammaproteobacteria bacterium]|nr:hypothetical protein [Gammaproteobacteria bacterium]